MNISSIVVQTVPKFLDEVVNALKNSDACDYHLHDEKGRILITIEGDSDNQLLGIAIADDGAGIDPNKIRKKLVLLGENDVDKISDEDIVYHIFDYPSHPARY